MTQSVPVTHWPERHGSRNLKVRVAEPLTFPICEPGPGTLRIQPRCYGNKAAIFTYRHFYSFPPFIPGQRFIFLSKWPLLFYDTSQPRTHGTQGSCEFSSSQGTPVILWRTSMGAGGVQSSRKPPHLGHCKLWPRETAVCLIQDGSRLVFTWWSFGDLSGIAQLETGIPAIPQGGGPCWPRPPSSAQQSFGHRVLLTGGQSWAR
uniref:Uncharacterized protein n=1 Tax=Myotis myotis TaxID=51298 RepID=A0A7J7WHT3_MYOMY|nr:hypothetical protein mMyoMyo1_012091 [Myotis myotis]